LERLAEEVWVDVPAAHDDADPLPADVAVRLEDRGDTRGARALREHLRALEEHDDRARDGLVADRDHVVDVLANDRERSLRGTAHRDAVRDGRRRALGDASRAERLSERRCAVRLHADDSQAWLPLRRRERDARDEPAAADRHDERVELVRVLEHLERHGALTGDDVVVIERMHVRASALARDLERDRVRFVVATVREHGLRAAALDSGELGERYTLGEHDGHRRANKLRGERDALPVVPGGCGHDTGGALCRIETRERVQRTADLEGASALEVLELEIHLAPGELRERRRSLSWCVTDVRRDARSGLDDRGARERRLLHDGHDATRSKARRSRRTPSSIRSRVGPLMENRNASE